MKVTILILPKHSDKSGVWDVQCVFTLLTFGICQRHYTPAHNLETEAQGN